MLGFTTLVSAFGSSIFSAATVAVSREFGVSSQVGLLGVSLYVLGFATGPTLWAPLSELRGRRLPLVISMFGFSIFQVAVAVAKDLQTVLLCRFWGGFFGACPLAVVAAVFSDMFDNKSRGLAITVFSMTVFSGPLLAPFIGGFITESDLGWRWTEYLTAIMGFAAFGLDLVFLQETYPPSSWSRKRPIYVVVPRIGVSTPNRRRSRSTSASSSPRTSVVPYAFSSPNPLCFCCRFICPSSTACSTCS